MKTNLHVLPICFALFLILQGCSGKEQPVKEQPGATNNQNQKTEQQLAAIETAIGQLAETIYSPGAVHTDTAATLTRLDSLPENEREAQTISFRLEVIRESINNLSRSYADKSATAKECKRVIVGYSSCNCAPNPNGTIHCDLCPIYKLVCQ